MRYIILCLFLSVSFFAKSQETLSTEFKNLFEVVANKSVAWNSLINHLRQNSNLESYKLMTDTVYTDPCQQIAQQGMSCPKIDYLRYFKRATGSDTVTIDNGSIRMDYLFETNKRPGSDTIINIDTITSVNFNFTLINNDVFPSKKMKRILFEKVYQTLQEQIAVSYGNSAVENINQNGVYKSAYWTIQSGGSILARITIRYNNQAQGYRVVFSSHIYPRR